MAPHDSASERPGAAGPTGCDDVDQVGRIQQRLADKGLTVGAAESLTGGSLAALWTDVPGASATFRGGVVCYASDVKVGVLGVPRSVVEEHGVVSAPCAAAMATGALRLLAVDVALATTGVAGPDEQEGKRVGTVFVAVSLDDDRVEVRELALTGNRSQIRKRTVTAVLDLLEQVVLGGR